MSSPNDPESTEHTSSTGGSSEGCVGFWRSCWNLLRHTLGWSRAMSATESSGDDDTATAEVLDGEPLLIAMWREEQFRALGFDEIRVEMLAHSEADLGLARALICAGCTKETAWRILS